MESVADSPEGSQGRGIVMDIWGSSGDKGNMHDYITI